MKKTIHIFLIVFLFIPIYSMSEHVEKCTIAKALDKELICYALRMNQRDVKFYDADNNCIYIAPKPINGLETHRTRLTEYGKWQPPLNLNPGKVICADEGTQKDRMFALQCWKESTGQGVIMGYLDGPTYLKFRIDDDSSKQRFIARTALQTPRVLFDGKNQDGYMLIGGQIKKTPYDYQPCLLPKYAQDFVTKYAIFLARMSSHQTNTYNDNNYGEQIYLRRVYPGEREQHNIIFDNEGNKIGTRPAKPLEFDYQKVKEGTLATLALCNNANKFVIIDGNINIYSIIAKYDKVGHNDCMYDIELLCSKKLIQGLKKISFLTPRTLICLSCQGQIYTIAYDEDKQNIASYEEQKFLNKEKQPIKFKNYAVNAKKPYQLILQTMNDQLIYWTARSCNSNPHASVVIFDKKDCENFWYYKNTLSLINKDDQVETYIVKNFDLKV